MPEPNTLPGFEALLEPVNARPADIDMSDGKTYTAEKLYIQHPNVFKSAALLLFKNGLSERSVAAALMLSVNTVRAIRDMVAQGKVSDAARAAFFIKSRAASARKVLQLRALEVIQDRIEDEDEAQKISVETLLSIVKTVDTLEGQIPGQKKGADADAEIIDVECFDAVINGLKGDGNPRAADGCGETTGDAQDDYDRTVEELDETEPGCSTRSTK